ncbi:hypothetical protein KQ693_05755 [Thermus sp. PS18]|uniref:hypothetical protein n=1 Tax=Thermus sp. PS18 TaxID=2849039 RepID=UPI002264CB03|nr:hypothetical protein [Thermus sp. PS18]UZX16534.1 hypothetical protein KQ693_05755 [Thermus sp. PS18]
MGIFKGMVVEQSGEYVVREPGTYEFQLVEVQAGLLASQFSEEPKPALRFVFEDDDGRISGLVNIPAIGRLPDGSYGLTYNEKSKFWAVVGALWGRAIGPQEAPLLDMDIPGVSSPEDLHRLPLFFTDGQEPVKGVVIRMGEEEITAPGRPVLLTIVAKDKGDRKVNNIVQYAPVPRRKAKAQEAAKHLW